MSLSDELALAKSFDKSELAYCIINVILNEEGEPSDWEFAYLNEALAKLEGLSKEKLLHHRFFEIFPNADKKWLEHYYAAAYLDKSSVFEDISREIHSVLRIRCFPVEYGYCGCILEDISDWVAISRKASETLTDRIEQELMLRQNEQLLRILTSDMYSSIFRVNMATWVVTRIDTRQNGTLSAQIGDFERFRLRKMRMISDQDRGAMEQFISKEHLLQLKNGEKSAFSFHGRHEKKNSVAAAYTTTIYRYNINEIPYAVIVTVNHTDAVHREIENAQKLKAAQKKLEEAIAAKDRANQAKSRFLSNMSHDIRTPMNAIVGFTELAARHLDKPELLRKYLSKIDVSGRYLLTLINDILEFASIERGDLQLCEQEFSLKELLQDVYTLTQGDISVHHLTVEDSEIVHSFICADRLKLSRILLNIVGNAVKFTPAGGEIQIKAEELQNTVEGEITQYRFTIQDSGIGMTKDFLSHLFEEFSQENKQISRNGRGTGLGMAITKKLVDFMQGTISVKSIVGSGSTFTVLLPLKPVENATECRAEIPDFRCVGKKRILLAEDNYLNQEIAVTLLSEAGFEVDPVSNGLEAVERINNSENGKYDLILMDVRMPIMDGYTAAREIRALPDHYAKKIPIIALSADAFETDKLLAMEAGMDGHISKPIGIEELGRSIQRFLGVF